MSEHSNNKKDIDELSGIETTGHEWDGLKELNNPLPRWWVWVFIICTIWAMWYWVIYPSWPTLNGATQGTSGYTQFNELSESQAEIQNRQATYLDRFEKTSDEDVMNNQELYAFAMAGGKSAFKDNCATCHGNGAEGRKGYPNLNDDDWLWGGSLSAIHQTLQYGIRADNYDTRQSQMPSFGKSGLLKRDEINAVTDYVLAWSSGEKLPTYERGAAIFESQCASCHGANGKGLREFGAPNLTDKIWLYGGNRDEIYANIYNARAGMMPAWKDRLDQNTIRQLTIYLHQLGGGEAEPKIQIEDIEEKALIKEE
ncbi:MAG: cytochrome-c oxidase, cbb3-type subunit III [Alphaproteobacteria bacterium]